MFKTMMTLFALSALVLTAEPVRVGGTEQQKKLIQKAVPVYPPDAKKNGVSGTVKLQAVIAKDGKVKDVKVLQGDPALVEAAVAAVRQWVYEPTVLNGEPVEVVTDINVNFTLKK